MTRKHIDEMDLIRLVLCDMLNHNLEIHKTKDGQVIIDNTNKLALIE